jgi:nucleoside-diphosphate-sugar epimerase
MNCDIADGRALNIGPGKAVSINRIAEMVGGPLIYQASRAGDMSHTLADFSHAENILGWRPQVSTDQGLRELIELEGLRDRDDRPHAN